MRHFFFHFLLSLQFFAQFQPINASELDLTPVAFKGRFRSFDAHARLWLYDFYHSEHIKPLHRASFYSQNGSAQDLLWKMHFLGHAPFDNAPFFWIDDPELKKLLNITENRISYNTLNHAINENKTTNLNLLRPLLIYFFLKNYRDPANRARNEKQELLQLSSGLWIMFQGDNIIVASAPTSPPWNFLSPGMVLAEGARQKTEVLLHNHKTVADAVQSLLSAMQQYSSFKNDDENLKLNNALTELQAHKLRPQDIAETIETQFPLSQRLMSSGALRMLPSKRIQGEWLPIKALTIQVYEPPLNTLKPIKNFTLYSDEDFNAIRNTYLKLDSAMNKFNTPSFDQKETDGLTQQLAKQLQQAYQTLAGTPYVIAGEKFLTYPTQGQLQAENFYYHAPLTEFAILFYGAALLAWILGYFLKPSWYWWVGTISLLIAFSLHTFLLGLRSYILQRPPVSNMFETVIYVPWISVLASLILYAILRKKAILIAAALSAISLLVILQTTGLNSGLENVQAVLDSQYWLLIHVLMVVGSYGAFLLAGILGHFYLVSYGIRGEETTSIHYIGKCLLQCMYLGVAMLIPGTILGGVWAAESWGRFWDWDPKEAWAFISICTYLLWIHAYTFHLIKYFGLAIGSIIGLQVISFTWYGVNYILGTGLHSYGFGSGGEIYYYLFLAIETLFIVFMWRRKNIIDSKRYNLV